jgi:hypothetical protein
MTRDTDTPLPTPRLGRPTDRVPDLRATPTVLVFAGAAFAAGGLVGWAAAAVTR